VSGQNGSTVEETINLTQLDPHGKEMRAIRGAEIALIPQEPMSAFSPVHTIGNQLIEAIMLHRTTNKREARQVAIDLDCNQPFYARRQRERQGAATGPDLEKEIVGSRANRFDDATHPAGFEEVLAEAFACLHSSSSSPAPPRSSAGEPSRRFRRSQYRSSISSISSSLRPK